MYSEAKHHLHSLPDKNTLHDESEELYKPKLLQNNLPTFFKNGSIIKEKKKGQRNCSQPRD